MEINKSLLMYTPYSFGFISFMVYFTQITINIAVLELLCCATTPQMIQATRPHKKSS